MNHLIRYRGLKTQKSYTFIIRLSKQLKSLYPAVLFVLLSLSLLTLSSCIERKHIQPTTQMDAEPQFWVRVLLFDNIRNCSLKAKSTLYITDFQTQSRIAKFTKADLPVKITVSNGKLFINDRVFTNRRLLIKTDSPYIFNINGFDYRGKLKLIINADATFDAVNMVPLEPYLEGVVGAEMPDYWESAALQAQTIAARTYCLYIKNRFGHKRHWDVTRTQSNQVYKGLAAESSRIRRAVKKTYGKVLVCTLPDGTKGIFPAYYSTICGGHTENSKNVFGGDSLEPLAGVPCPYCKYTAKTRFFYWPMVKFEKKTVTANLLKKYPKLKALGEIINIVPTRKSVYDTDGITRITMVELSGSTGKKDSIRAEDLRLSIDPSGRKIKSTICEILNMSDKWAFLSGRGFGHGVGMCQHGAQAMARKGKNAKQILSHYYPASKIKSLY